MLITHGLFCLCYFKNDREDSRLPLKEVSKPLPDRWRTSTVLTCAGRVWCRAVNLNGRIPIILISVIPNCFTGATLDRFLAKRSFFVRFRLARDIRIPSGIISLEDSWCGFAAEIAIKALIINVVFSKRVVVVAVCKLWHVRQVFLATFRIRRRRAGCVDDTTDAIRVVACIRFVRPRLTDGSATDSDMVGQVHQLGAEIHRQPAWLRLE